MMRRFGERLAAALVLGASFCALPACERDASGLVEWTPADHDHQVEPKSRGRNAAIAQQKKANPHAPPSQRNQVVDVTWTKQCATCHGRRGKGDGPSSTMVKARDLTNPEFQASVSDEQLRKVIREGKDKMPAFNLPDSVIDGLVEHVRGFARKRRGAEPDDEGAEGAEGDPTEGPAPNAPAAATVEPSGAAGADKSAPTPTGSAPSGAAPGGASSAAPAPPPAPR